MTSRRATGLLCSVLVLGAFLTACGSASQLPTQTTTTFGGLPTTAPPTTFPDLPTTTPPTSTLPTSTLPATTTTTPTTFPPTTTTTPTTFPPTTTTTTVPATTTTTVPTTTTTVAPAGSTSSESWWWLAALLVLLAAGIVTWILLASRRRARQLAAWRQSTDGVLATALLVRGLLPQTGAQITDQSHWESVRNQVTAAAGDLEAAGSTAPSDDLGRAALGTASALTAVTSALESDRLIRESAQRPTEGQLAESDALVRAHRQELDYALAQLTEVVRPPLDNAT